jgi:hypothetical protein
MDKQIQKLADLAAYLDSRGHREEADLVDRMMLLSMAQGKKLQISGKTYTDAASAWKDYTGQNYIYYAMALGLPSGSASEDVQAALNQYFAVQPEGQIPEGAQKTIEPGWTEQLGQAWESVKTWPARKLEEWQGTPVKEPSRREYRGMGTAGVSPEELGLEE